MRKHLVRIAAVGVGFALIVAASALAKPEVVRVGNLFLRDNGGISPSKLPKHKQAPIAAHLNARIGTVDSSHPPAIESVIADFDRTIQVNAKGLPVCTEDQLVARSTGGAKKACADAIVGTGEGEVEVAFPEQAPFTAKGPIVLFNGGIHGGTTLLFIHTYVNVPAPTAVIVTVKLTRIHRGHYGIHAVAQIPRIAGGAGSVTKFKLTINRTFTYGAKNESYLTASCPTGNYFAEGKVRFSDGTALKITHVLPCTPMG
ncbi:MAG TPA: hypothetical protein VH275_11295 [Solirubrobacterales bacterium]|jgi:hypothetical protein|nr:hypothetical protein [Solirubrobacterales bacterium]